MADGSIVFDVKVDDANAKKQLDELKAKAEKVSKELTELESGKATEQGRYDKLTAKLDVAKAKLEEMKAASKGAFSADEIAEQKETVASLEHLWTEAGKKVQQYGKDIEKAKATLDKIEAKQGEVVKKTAEASDASGNFSKNMTRLNKRFKSLVASALLFTVVTKAFTALRDYIGEFFTVNEKTRAELEKMKGALLTIGQIFLQTILPVAIRVMQVINAILQTVAKVLSVIAGVALGDAAKAAEGYEAQKKAIAGVGGAAKKASKQLASFDEINKLSSESSSSGGGAGGAEIAPNFDWLTDIDEKTKNLANIILGIGAAFATWKIASSLAGSISSVTSGIFLLVAGLGLLAAGFAGAYKDGWQLKDVLLSMAGLLSSGLGIALLTGSWIPALIAGIAALVLAFTVAYGQGENLIIGLRNIFEGFVKFFKGVFAGDLEMSLAGIGQIFNGLRQVVFSVIDAAKNMFNSFLDWLDQKTGGRFTNIINSVRDIFNSRMTNIKDLVANTITTIKGIFEGLVTFITGVFTDDWDLAWEGLKTSFKAIANGVIGIVENLVNRVITGINKIIAGLNTLQIDVPEGVPIFGGTKFGFNIPPIPPKHIPRLATGAVIPPNREFMAVLGDQRSGTNIEAPLETMVQAFRTALAEGAGNRGTAYLMVDRTVLGQLVYDLNNAESQRVGVKLVKGGV